jgi:hypothetical protein
MRNTLSWKPLNQGLYPTAEMLTFLKEDGVKEADVEKYYRTIDTGQTFIRLTAKKRVWLRIRISHTNNIFADVDPNNVRVILLNQALLIGSAFFTSIAITNRLYSAIADLTVWLRIETLTTPRAASSRQKKRAASVCQILCRLRVWIDTTASLRMFVVTYNMKYKTYITMSKSSTISLDVLLSPQKECWTLQLRS